MRKQLSLCLGIVALCVCLVQPASAETGARRPQGYSTGIGAGWSFTGTDVLTPNSVSARFRLASGLTIEPLVIINYDQSTTGMTGAEDSVVKEFTLSAGALARIPIAGRDKVDLELLVGGGISVVSGTDDPAGANNAIDTSTIGIGAVWGVSVEYFISHHWSWSFDATNPFVTYETTKISPPGGTDATVTDLQVGAIFAPTVRLMTHIYF